MTDYFFGREEMLSPTDATAALIALPGQRYLMQLRDQKPRIFYPGHWGVFEGALNPGETATQCLYRELGEELGLSGVEFRFFTRITLDFSYCGLGSLDRHYFVGEIDDTMLARLQLGEGQQMRVFSTSELVSTPRVVPYDSLAIWMHATIGQIRFENSTDRQLRDCD